MVSNRIATLSCLGVVATAVIASNGVAAAPQYSAGDSVTLSGQTPSTDYHFAAFPTTSAGYFNGTTDESGSYTFKAPSTLADGEYTVFATSDNKNYTEVTKFNYEGPKRRYRRHSDHSEPQQTFGYPGYGRESITAIATNGAGTRASAQIGLVTMASLLGALTLF